MFRGGSLFSVLVCVLAIVTAQASVKQDEKPRPIVVMIDHEAHGFTYTINFEKATDLLLALSKKHTETPEAKVILLVHNEVTLAMLNNMIGILSKAGYIGPPRVFVFDSYKHAMNELNFTYSPKIPFSPAGNVPAKK